MSLLDRRRSAQSTTWAAIALEKARSAQAPWSPRERRRRGSVPRDLLLRATALWNDGKTAREVGLTLGWQGNGASLLALARYHLGEKALKPHPYKRPYVSKVAPVTGPLTMSSLGRRYLRKVGAGPSVEFIFRDEHGREEVWLPTDDLGGIRFRRMRLVFKGVMGARV